MQRTCSRALGSRAARGAKLAPKGTLLHTILYLRRATDIAHGSMEPGTRFACIAKSRISVLQGHAAVARDKVERCHDRPPEDLVCDGTRRPEVSSDLLGVSAIIPCACMRAEPTGPHPLSWGSKTRSTNGHEGLQLQHSPRDCPRSREDGTRADSSGGAHPPPVGPSDIRPPTAAMILSLVLWSWDRQDRIACAHRRLRSKKPLPLPLLFLSSPHPLSLASPRVTIAISTIAKHTLPVSQGCSWDHPDSVPREYDGCKFVQGRPVADYNDLLACIQESPCEIVDDRAQMVILRDPRPVTVSCFFHQMNYNRGAIKGTVEDYVMEMLPSVAQWVAIRHFLFEEMLADRSTVFWYDDAIDQPLTWHQRWYESVGLRLPSDVIEAASFASSGNGASNYRMPHPGGGHAAVDRSFKDEIGEELQAYMDDVVRQWLPPVLLAKIGLV